METKLTLIAKRAKEDRQCKFNNLMHLITRRSLTDCFHMLKRGKAPGIDQTTLEAYENNLEANLEDLMVRMKRMSYRPRPVRRVYIPKPDGKRRALGIPTVEDKLVQMAFARILEAMYEADFLDISYGFRKGRNCHQALARIDQAVMHKPVNAVIDADIQGFFDNVNHEWMQRCLEERISDRKFIRYVLRMLKSGVMEEGTFLQTDKGTPQGGVISPVLANIYLHHVLDLWFQYRIKKEVRGYVEMVRYCDDFIILVEYEEEAQQILRRLTERLSKFDLHLSEDKTRIVRFGWKAQKEHDEGGPKPGTFAFLGFTHYCGKGRKGSFKVGRRTEKKRFCRSVQSVKSWLKYNRNAVPLMELHARVSGMLMGHFRYYGVSDNSRSLQIFHHVVVKLLFKWVNRRSQRKSFSWDRFEDYLNRYPLPTPRIYHCLYHRAF